MSISNEAELQGMMRISEIVAIVLKSMREYAQPGMSARELDEFGGKLLSEMGAKSAPRLTYGFPGWTCISVNHEIAHGIPSAKKIFLEGDLINIDVSAESGGYWSDNGGSFVLGPDKHGHAKLVNASKLILLNAIALIRPEMRLAELGRFIENAAKQMGFRVIRNLTGHGIGRSLHEYPKSVPNYYERFNTNRFSRNMVVAVETFISTGTSAARNGNDGWTLVTGDKSFTAQHEHTIMITETEPLILTASNGIFN
jgi:methionyl aminopeptidase